ncbi:hypothetical protein J437_LFUL003676 [Ladona fulva]|uniref:Protein tipE n=1 Tax=Ladona fulva TaxID=123851 RepID=A0A8K0JVZ6_LADFU|nr:hypothetical protein J437_LFUL003676 [Ladona fulva]
MERQAIMGSEAELARDDGASSPEGGSGRSSTCGRPVVPEVPPELIVPLAEKAKFYASLCLGTTAILSAFAFLFLIPFVVDPAISTILSEYEQEAVTCVTSKVTYAEGLRNCSWSSCREGCTTAALRCHQILVNYSRMPYSESLRRMEEMEKAPPPQPKAEEIAAPEEAATQLAPSTEGDEEEEEIDEGGGFLEWDVVDTRFFVNTEGCGYPPRVNCSVFAKTYRMDPNRDPSKPKIFPCYYSRTYPERVVAKYSSEENIRHLVLSLIVPNILFVGSIAILSYWYCPGCCGRGRGEGVGSVVGSVACSPVLGSGSGGSLRRGSGKSLRGSSSTDRLPTKEEGSVRLRKNTRVGMSASLK